MSEQKSTQNSSGALELIMLRNAFYRDNYKRALMALFLVFILNCTLAAAIFYKVTHPVQPQYFPTTADGRIITWHSLKDPVVTDDYVEQWAANAIRKAFSLDYLHYKQQLQNASDNFTADGWKYFIQSLKSSNNLKTLTSLKMVSSAKITGAPQIVQKEVVDGRFAWKIQVPVLVTYTNANKTIPLPLDVTLIVLRVPVKDNPNRIAINNFLPVPQKTAEQNLLTEGF